MFQVGRYDPGLNQKRQKKKRKKRKRLRSEDETSENGATRQQTYAPVLSQAIVAEALDDLGIEEDADKIILPDIDTEMRSDLVEETMPGVDNSLPPRFPIEEAAAKWKLAPFLLENLQQDGVKHFFPIQAVSLPDVIISERHSHIQARDVCITAPTGSGKTLAYVLPILNSLANRKVRRLRALIVLPSRDLAKQVYQVFQRYISGSSLSAGLAIGQSDFREEQVALKVHHTDNSAEAVRLRLKGDPDNIPLALDSVSLATEEQNIHKSGVDILVCTPGKLVDHLDNTPGFSLHHLRYLVVDEADRLLSQSYQNWVGRVIQSSNSSSVAGWKELVKNRNMLLKPKLSPSGESMVLESRTWRRGGVSGDDSNFNTNDNFSSAAAAACQRVQLRKFLVSATMTRDPNKLSALKLVNPKFFDVHQSIEVGKDFSAQKYSMPPDLAEFTIECTAEQKPIVLIAVLLDHIQTSAKSDDSNGTIVVFTSNLDSTHRLTRMLQLIWAECELGPPGAVLEFSSSLNQNERSALMSRCKTGSVSVIVCSDSLSRGVDIDSIGMVVNYDIPVLAKTYLHRCGRTARAGNQGTAISLLKIGQKLQFLKMRSLINDPERVQKGSVKKNLVRDVIPKHGQSIRALREILEAEDKGDINRTEQLRPDMWRET